MKVLAAQSCPTFCDSWTVAHQAPLSMEFSRQEYWSGLPFSFPGDLPNLEIKNTSLVSPAFPSGFFTTRATWEVYISFVWFFIFMLSSYVIWYLRWESLQFGDFLLLALIHHISFHQATYITNSKYLGIDSRW